ncbi:MAG: L,D-transpeptidase, partial [Chloroflexota bacterium]|nr:L,D-transpeptidase [Chloroflexota bacterium]
LWSQWFEYARLELEPVPFDLATIDNVKRHQIGRSFAYRAGYSERLVAFKPRSEGPERFFPETGHTLAMGFRIAYEQQSGAARLGLPISEEFDVGDTTYQFFEYGALTWGSAGVAEFLTLGRLDAVIHGQLAYWQPQPWDAFDWDSTDMIELSELLPGARTIEINLSTYTLTARVGEKVVLESIVSIGSPNSKTVTGDFAIYLKYEIQSLSGIGWDGEPYSAPNTPWVMYFYEDYAVHSSLTRSEYGYADSQGCVVPPMEVAEQLWLWADYGTPVWIHY